ncbi:MAG: glycosyltransferase [Actinomycetota bacterium]|nr:glycosyltransferase [Actinomycetota bacterium]
MTGTTPYRDGTPLVTAIIPVYNGERFVADAIRSVLAQTYPNVECLVVDDGSKDASGEVVKAFAPDVRYVLKENGGVASARNRGVSQARGEFVAFLDADDAWAPTKIEKQMDVFRAQPDAGLVYSGMRLVDEAMRPIGELEPAPPPLALRNTLLLEQPSATGIGSTALLPASVFQAVGGFDERLSTSADCDLTCRIALRHPMACSPEPLALYRCHGSQMSSDPRVLEHDMLLIYEKLFAGGLLPPEVSALRRRAYANLYFMLAATALNRGETGPFLRYVVRAATYDPRRVAPLLARRLSGGKPAVPAPTLGAG